MGPDASVRVPLVGLDAKLNMARKTPAQESAVANKMRGLKIPDSEVGFFRIRVCFR